MLRSYAFIHDLKLPPARRTRRATFARKLYRKALTWVSVKSNKNLTYLSGEIYCMLFKIARIRQKSKLLPFDLSIFKLGLKPGRAVFAKTRL